MEGWYNYVPECYGNGTGPSKDEATNPWTKGLRPMGIKAIRGTELGEGNRGTPHHTLNRSPGVIMPIKIHAFLNVGTEA